MSRLEGSFKIVNTVFQQDDILHFDKLAHKFWRLFSEDEDEDIFLGLLFHPVSLRFVSGWLYEDKVFLKVTSLHLLTINSEL